MSTDWMDRSKQRNQLCLACVKAARIPAHLLLQLLHVRLRTASHRFRVFRDCQSSEPAWVAAVVRGRMRSPMLNTRLLKRQGNYISMPPGIARGLSSSCSSEIRASVVSISPAIDAAFCNAQRVTFAGSITPAATRSSKVSVAAL
jgi:hypothetical protein